MEFEYISEELAWYTRNREIFKCDFLENTSKVY